MCVGRNNKVVVIVAYYLAIIKLRDRPQSTEPQSIERRRREGREGT